MKRGVNKRVSIQRTVTYSFSRADLIKRLKLPDDAEITVTIPAGDGTGTIGMFTIADNQVVGSVDVHVQERW